MEHSRDEAARKKREAWLKVRCTKPRRLATLLYATPCDGSKGDPALRLPNGGYVGLKAVTKMMREAALKLKK